MMACDASAPASAVSARVSNALSAPDSTLSSGSNSPMRPVEHTATSSALAPMRLATFSAVALDCSYPGLPGACVGAAGVQNHGLHMAVGYDVPRPLHRGRAETVRGEHAGSGVKRSIVDHESQILLAFDRGNASCHASCGKTLCERYAHGATPIFVNPASSGSPNATFSDCTACPAVPRLRLSMAANASSGRHDGRRPLECGPR